MANKRTGGTSPRGRDVSVTEDNVDTATDVDQEMAAISRDLDAIGCQLGSGNQAEEGQLAQISLQLDTIQQLVERFSGDVCPHQDGDTEGEVPCGLDASERLPDEIWVTVFSFLSQQELCVLATVSRRFYRLALDPSLWRQECGRILAVGQDFHLYRNCLTSEFYNRARHRPNAGIFFYQQKFKTWAMTLKSYVLVLRDLLCKNIEYRKDSNY
jgi:hypothetical protein